MSLEVTMSGDAALPTFADITITELDAADTSKLDLLPFGVVGLDGSNCSAHYNLWETQMAGLSRDSVIGQDFFFTTGLCMKNSS